MEEFFSSVNFLENGCWLWTGPRCANGRYGRVKKAAGPTLVMAHRMAYLMWNGVPGKGQVVCHTCDNGLCVNPAHIFLGTPRDNFNDMVRKGRECFGLANNSQAGESNAHAKLTRVVVDNIREYHRQTGCNMTELAQQFRLKSRGHAHNIVTHRIWQ